MVFYEDDTSSTISVGALKGASGGDVYRFCIPMMVLTTLSVALRVYVRGYMTRTFGVEDWLIIPAYVRNLSSISDSISTDRSRSCSWYSVYVRL
jgi:hypothetical protein